MKDVKSSSESWCSRGYSNSKLVLAISHCWSLLYHWCKLNLWLSSIASFPNPGWIRSYIPAHAAIIAYLAFTSLWRLHRIRKHVVITNSCVFRTLLKVFAKLYTCRNCIVPRHYHGCWDWWEEEIAGIHNPPLAAAASDSVRVAVLKLLREFHVSLQNLSQVQILATCLQL